MMVLRCVGRHRVGAHRYTLSSHTRLMVATKMWSQCRPEKIRTAAKLLTVLSYGDPRCGSRFFTKVLSIFLFCYVLRENFFHARRKPAWNFVGKNFFWVSGSAQRCARIFMLLFFLQYIFSSYRNYFLI